jgi:hypothetical protein
MNKKVLGIAIFLMAVAMLATPMVLATPGAPKSNEKFEDFALLCSGVGSGVFDRDWVTSNPHVEEIVPEDPEDPPVVKTYHARGGGWVTGDVVELMVGSDTYTMDTTPVSVDWTTTTHTEAIINNDGTVKRYNLKLTDVVTVCDDDVEIGTLILELKSSIVPGRDPVYFGTLVGYGTGALKGVKISGIDVGLVDPVNGLFLRTGTITGWPY